ncbi:MAG: nuclear transport factor 2 family protein [Candidatus Omnitrophica bacterium]|nr:nuclear transport factor 2 family protein [Candidatus Omnitrophota bacterium]
MGSKAEVENFVKKFMNTWSSYDTENLNRMLVEDRHAAHIGTDADEYMVGKKALLTRIESIRKTGIGMTTKVKQRQINIVGGNRAAHFALKFDTKIYKNGKLIKKLDNVRTTGFLVKKGKEWKLAGSHVSMPVKGQAVKYKNKG